MAPEDPGRLLKRWRERNNLSQRLLSIQLEIAATDVSDYECGRKRPNLDRAFKIEDVTGIDARVWRSSAAA